MGQADRQDERRDAAVGIQPTHATPPPLHRRSGRVALLVIPQVYHAAADSEGGGDGESGRGREEACSFLLASDSRRRLSE